MAPTVPRDKKIFIVPVQEEVRNYFRILMGDSTKQNCWPADKCNMEADSLLDHYQANGWVQGRGKPIKDWKAACRNWVRNAMKGSFEAPKKAPEIHQLPRETGTPDFLIAVKQLDKTAKEINYLFSRYMENPEHCTTISVETVQYDYLKLKGMINFSKEKTEQIRSAAHTAIAEKGIKLDDVREKIFMKKIAVIEFFKSFQSTGKEAIFHEN